MEEQPSPRYDLAATGPPDRLFNAPVIDTETHVFVRCWPIETSPQVSEVEPVTRTDHPGSLLVAEMDRVGVEAAILIGYDGFDFADFMQRSFAQARLFHADEPLCGRAEDHGRLVAPTMRITVPQRFLFKQTAAFLQHFNDMLVGSKHALARE